ERLGDSQKVDVALAELGSRAEELGFLRARNRLALRRAALRDGLGAPARGLFEHALELAKSSGDPAARLLAWQGLAQIAVNNADGDLTKSAVLEILKLGVELGREPEVLQRVSVLAVSPGKGAAVAAKLLGLRALQRNEPLIAGSWLREALRRDPTDAVAASQLEALCIAQAVWLELAGLYQFQAERSEGPRRAAYLARLAELLEDELGRKPEASAAYGAAAAAGLGLSALREQVRILQEAQDKAGAARALDEGVARAPAGEARAEALLLRASYRRAQSELPGAAEDLERAVQMVPDFWPALIARAEVRAKLGDPMAARSLELALGRPGIEPSDLATGWSCVAQLYGGPLGKPEEARRAWEIVHREDPDQFEAVAFLRDAYRKAGELTVLCLLLEGELDRDPRGPNAPALRRDLATALAEQGLTEQSIVEWRKLFRQDPTSGEALEMLLAHVGGAGRHREAAELLETAASAQPEPERKAALLERLAGLCEEKLSDPLRAKALRTRAETVRTQSLFG
ncbi:MAG: hypothetical protein ACYCWW_06860, partial [Deltaproteobacteria bacterium]